jgi:hypothetical protein
MHEEHEARMRAAEQDQAERDALELSEIRIERMTPEQFRRHWYLTVELPSILWPLRGTDTTPEALAKRPLRTVRRRLEHDVETSGCYVDLRAALITYASGLHEAAAYWDDLADAAPADAARYRQLACDAREWGDRVARVDIEPYQLDPADRGYHYSTRAEWLEVMQRVALESVDDAQLGLSDEAGEAVAP